MEVHHEKLCHDARVGSEGYEESGAKKSKTGMILFPQPSDDLNDPLNWSQGRKLAILATLCLAACTGLGGPLVDLIPLGPQAKLYGKTSTQEAYSTSAALAGVAVGPLISLPLAKRYGISSVIFWSLVGLCICNIWAALMTKESDYIAYVMSRLFAGLFGGNPSVFGAQPIIEMFFIHERGRALSAFHVSFLAGTQVVPTLGAFVGAHAHWPVIYRWIIGLCGLAILLAFLFLEETGFDRSGSVNYPTVPDAFIARRLATLFPGSRVMPPMSLYAMARATTMPLIIGITPVTIFIGVFMMVSFAFAVMLVSLTNIFLETPVSKGGYGYSVQQNALVFFAVWLGLLGSQLHGHLLNDRIPVRLYRRHANKWAPEYRLHSLWLPALFLIPVGLGIFGASLKYHLPPAVLSLGIFLSVLGASAIVPVSVNYTIECFPQFPTECAIIMGLYRISFATTTACFIDPWMGAVGIGWVFGMAALFSAASLVLVAALVLWGPRIRRWGFAATRHDG